MLALAAFVRAHPAHAVDPAFTRFIASLRSDAERAGVSRATFEAATRGLEPDDKLPDLELPGRKPQLAPQAEFVQVPADYLNEGSIARLAAAGREVRQKHRATLDRIERDFGVPGAIVLAIWARETDYGRFKPTYNAIRTLATQAYVGRRKEQFRNEFVLALKMMQDGYGSPQMRSSWAGAIGLTQLIPSEFYKNAVDFDGDGRIDIFNSVPDALAITAKQLRSKGWQPGLRWAYEVRAPQGADCTLGVPEVSRPIGEWIGTGFVPADGARLTGSEQAQSASLLQPEGIYGPAFLTTKNYFVIKDYNFSDLYVLFVGHLADRIAGRGRFVTPWSATQQMRTADVETMQKYLARIGLYNDKIDGKAGMQTRAALGAFQKQARLKVDCWPNAESLRAMTAR
ncbi:lytic murein transglycosylase [Bradyrhizobium sp. LHD-71]|nr:lytic murein transglycosylase [Bradyrhizobium sp. LHD-71]MDQ8727769.1 lytic murein transglycosylase [Bradyrhizobium sp. LHD-71]